MHIIIQTGRRGKIWEDAVPNKTKFFCFSTEGLVSVYNMYDHGSNHKPSEVRSQMDSCGMLVEQKGNKIIYRCNDVGFEPKFDALVFSIEIL